MRRLLTVWAVLACGAVGADRDALIRQVATYEYGKDPSAVRELEDMALHAASPGDAAAMEKALLAGLASAATSAAKDAFCRDLAIVGSDASVPALAAMLSGAPTAEMARYALERIPGVAASAALRQALARTSPPVQTGLVVSLGRRKDAASVGDIRKLLGSADARLAQAAAEALAHIGTPPARQALLDAQSSPAISAALLQIADAEIYRRLYTSNQSEAVRIAALEGLARTDASQALPLLRAALKSGPARIQAAAIRQLARLEGIELVKEVPAAPERARVEMLSMLSASGAPGVLPLLVEAAGDPSESIRVAALTGLATHGTAAEIPLLAQRAAMASGDEQSAARAALGSIRGDAADNAILTAIANAEPKVKVELIRAAGERGAVSAPDALLASASATDRAVRLESIRALRETAGPRHVPALLALLAKASSATDRKELERTVATAIRRSKEPVDNSVTEAYQSATDPDTRVSLLNILSAVGNSAALPLVRKALQDPNPDIQRAALNALSGWPTPEPLEDLLALARHAADPAKQILALRGYIRVVQIPSSRPPSETAKLMKTAMSVATRADEKRAILAVVQRLVCPESLELAKAAVNDPQVAAEAKLAATTLERALSFVK